MASTNQNVTLYKGEAKTIQITVTDDAGNAVDLSTATLLYRMATTAKAATSLIEKATADVTVTGTGHNVVDVPIGHGDTDQAHAKDYYHELRVTDAAGNPEVVVMTGTVSLLDSLTNAVP